jgi:hypothetical protein
MLHCQSSVRPKVVCGLATRSRGRPQAGFAHLWPPLTSNVSRHERCHHHCRRWECSPRRFGSLHELRGSRWRPTDAEVEEFLAFDRSQDQSVSERADVWDDQGAVHMLCVDSFGDPVEMTEEEALAFAERLKVAIDAAEAR